MMKKILYIICLVLIMTVIASCKKSIEVPSDIVLESGVISWNEVEKAESYVIKINDAEYEVTEARFVLNDLFGLLEVSVKTVIKDRESEFSEPVTFTVYKKLLTPTNVRREGNQVLWNAVSGANGYTVRINGVEFTTAQTSIAINAVVTLQVEVRANGLLSAYTQNSEYSAPILITVGTEQLQAPTNLQVSNGTLTFTGSANATSYEIYVNGNLYATITQTSYVIPQAVRDLAGAYLQVKAAASGYQTSVWSHKIYLQVTFIHNETELRALGEEGVYALANPIILTQPWIPKGFKGVLDGQGHTISGILIQTDGAQVGFFSFLEGAQISNLILEGSIQLVSGTYAPRIGGLAGLIQTSVISDVVIDIDITAQSSNGIGILGGVAGDLQDSDLTSVHYRGDIMATHMVTGGFAGRISNPQEQHVIRKSSVTSTITVIGGEQSYAGGFVGYMMSNTVTIEESFAKISLTGTSYVGGFVGYFGMGIIRHSYAQGTVNATHDVLIHAGGFIGRHEGYNAQAFQAMAMTTVLSTHTGTSIYKGSFTGHALGGTYANVYMQCTYDNTLSVLDRIGNPSQGRGDGISGFDLGAVSSLDGYSASIWDFSGDQPKLNWENES